jgi:hypothetical protein
MVRDNRGCWVLGAFLAWVNLVICAADLERSGPTSRRLSRILADMPGARSTSPISMHEADSFLIGVDMPGQWIYLIKCDIQE